MTIPANERTTQQCSSHKKLRRYNSAHTLVETWNFSSHTLWYGLLFFFNNLLVSFRLIFCSCYAIICCSNSPSRSIRVCWKNNIFWRLPLDRFSFRNMHLLRFPPISGAKEVPSLYSPDHHRALFTLWPGTTCWAIPHTTSYRLLIFAGTRKYRNISSWFNFIN